MMRTNDFSTMAQANQRPQKILWLCAMAASMVSLSAFAADRVTAAGSAPTFNKHIAPIVYKNCTGCHRPGEVAPFSLTNYEDVKKKLKNVVRATQQKIMPPWKAEPGFGEFKDERILTAQEIALIKQWADAGAPEGSASDLPPAPKFTDGWTLGPPDLILTMPEEYTVAAEGRDIYRCFVIPINNNEDQYVRAVEYRPSNRKVVHHALLFLDSMGQARKKDQADPGPGFKSFGGPGFIPTGGLGGWAPGYTPHPLPDGLGKYVKKGSDLALQVHFHPSGKPEKEKSQVGIYFAKTTPTRVIAGSAIGNHKINIAPGDKAYKVSGSLTLPVNLDLIAITPHAHLLCKEIKADATLPNGTKMPLIWIKDWDFDWQDQYHYKNAIKLPQGTKLDVQFTYDNSADNPNNPSNPPRPVKFGEQTTDEMALCFFEAACDSKADAMKLMMGNVAQRVANAFAGGEAPPAGAGGGANPGRGGRRNAMVEEMKKRFDKDGDGKLSPEEQEEAMKFARDLFGGGK